MATKRRSEAIWREERGLWQIGVQKDGVRRFFTSSTKGRKGKHEAENMADDWLSSGTEDMRAVDAWKSYVDYVEHNKSLSVYTQTERYGRLYISPIFGQKRLSKITPHMWQTCLDEAAGSGLSRRTCVNIRAHINAFLKFCRLNRWEHQSIADGDIVIPHGAVPEKPKKALTDSEIQTIFSVDELIYTHSHGPKYGTVMRKVHYIYAFRFLVLTGLRRGELCGLKTADVNGSTLTISRSVNTYGEMTAGKTDNARRSFTLTPSMLQVLKDQQCYLESINHGNSPWLFPDKYGEQTDPNRMYEQWRTYCEKTGIKSSLHELRHTFISLTKADLPMELLKAMVGHSTAMDTALVYGHEVDGDRERTAEIVEKTMQRHIKRCENVAE